MGCDLDRWAVDWSRFGGDGRWLLPLLCCNLLLWQPFASSNCNSDNDSLRRDADFDLRWLFAKFGLITLLVGVAVGDSTILRRLFDQEIVILLSYCGLWTVNKDKRYQDSSQPQWQRLSHPALSTWREAFLTLHLEYSYMNITAIVGFMMSNDNDATLLLIFWWDWSSKRGWSKFYLRWCHNVTERTSIVPLTSPTQVIASDKTTMMAAVSLLINQIAWFLPW